MSKQTISERYMTPLGEMDKKYKCIYEDDTVLHYSEHSSEIGCTAIPTVGLIPCGERLENSEDDKVRSEINHFHRLTEDLMRKYLPASGGRYFQDRATPSIDAVGQGEFVMPNRSSLRFYADKIQSKKALVVPCAEWNIAHYLAQLSCDVTAIDISGYGSFGYGLDIAELNARRLGVQDNIRFKHGDIASLQGVLSKTENFDIIQSMGVLHVFPVEKRNGIIDHMKSITVEGGWNFISLHSQTDPNYTTSKRAQFASLEQLRTLYSGWKIHQLVISVSKIPPDDGEEARGWCYDYGHHNVHIIAQKY